MVPFAGWEMPVQYDGIKEEHIAVRTHAGIFDVSHMGEIEVEGPGALAFLQRLVTNDVSRIEIGGAQYSLLLNEDAGFQAEWYRVMRHLPYETKLAMMGECHLFGPDGFPVTSLFNRAQGVQYTDRMANYFTGQGVVFADLLSKEAA